LLSTVTATPPLHTLSLHDALPISLSVPSVKIEHVDLRLASIPGEGTNARRRTDGIIGYDLLCGSVVTVDYHARRLTVTTPTAFRDRKSTRLNSSHLVISYAVFCLK